MMLKLGTMGFCPSKNYMQHEEEKFIVIRKSVFRRGAEKHSPKKDFSPESALDDGNLNSYLYPGVCILRSIE